MELLTHTVKGPSLVVAPLGDIQWSGKDGMTTQDHLKRHIDAMLERGAYFLGMGDYIDFLSPSNRQRLRGAALYDTAEDVIDAKGLELVHELYEKFLKPTVGRWIGLLEGHHYSQFRAGDTSDMRLCQMLKVPFLGTTACVRVQFMKSTVSYGSAILWAHHGARGAGSTQGAALNELQQVAASWEGVDVFFMGHVPKGVLAPLNRPFPYWPGRGIWRPMLVHKTVYLVRCGGFSKSYVQGAKQGQIPRGGYAEQRAMSPGFIGAPVVTFHMIRTQTDGHDRHELRTTVEVS